MARLLSIAVLLSIIANHLGTVLALSTTIDFNLLYQTTSNNESSTISNNHIFVDPSSSSNQKYKIIDNVYYVVKIKIGSEEVSAAIDFSSPDVWVSLSKYSLFNNTGTTISKKNSTSNDSNIGQWKNETMVILSQSAKNVSVWSVTNNSQLHPIINASIGLGGTTTTSNENSLTNSNLREHLLQQKITKATSYGIHLSAQNISSNSIGSGTVSFVSQPNEQTSYYSGKLSSFGISTTAAESVVYPLAQVDVISGNNGVMAQKSALKNAKSNVIFDRSKEHIYMPKDKISSILENLNITHSFNNDYNLFNVDCKASSNTLTGSNEKYLALKIGNTEILVPVKSLVANIFEKGTKNSGNCGFKIVPIDNLKNAYLKSYSSIVLGNSFLRYVYQFIDYDNKLVSIAQANVKVSPGLLFYSVLHSNIISKSSPTKLNSTKSLTSYLHSLDAEAHTLGYNGTSLYNKEYTAIRNISSIPSTTSSSKSISSTTTPLPSGWSIIGTSLDPAYSHPSTAYASNMTTTASSDTWLDSVSSLNSKWSPSYNSTLISSSSTLAGLVRATSIADLNTTVSPTSGLTSSSSSSTSLSTKLSFASSAPTISSTSSYTSTTLAAQASTVSVSTSNNKDNSQSSLATIASTFTFQQSVYSSIMKVVSDNGAAGPATAHPSFGFGFGSGSVSVVRHGVVTDITAPQHQNSK